MAKLTRGDGHIHYEIFGEGPDLLLVAGLGGRHEFWLPQVPALARRYRVVLHDHRGTGRSCRTAMQYSIGQMADDVLALMDALSIDSARLVGHSTGGAIAQHLALTRPERLDRIVISASWAGPDPAFHALFRLRQDILERCGPEAYLSEGTFLAHPGDWLAANWLQVAQTLSARLAAFPGTEIEIARIGAVLAHDLRSQIPRITVPTLVIAASDDLITPPHFSRELAETIPGARLDLLPRGGHFCPVTMAADYGARIAPFLADGETPR